MQIQTLLAIGALALISSGCTIPGEIVHAYRIGHARKQAQPYEAISNGTIPVTVGQAPAFSPAGLRTIAVIVITPENIQLRDAYWGPSRLLLPNRKSMIETVVDQELLTKGYRVAARSDIDSLLVEIGFRNHIAA